jgi:hypothetical protein
LKLWVGKVNPDATNLNLTCYEAAQMIWRFIRVEKQCEEVQGNWILGKFRKNDTRM